MLLEILSGKGVFQLEWWGYIVLALVLTHITIASVTLYLHRCQTHRSVDFHPAVNHFMRFWLWLTTAMVTHEWVTIHRKHHAKVESQDDPHSPAVLGINEVLYRGAELYHTESRNREDLEQYKHDRLPNDFLEQRLYIPHTSLGLAILFIIHFVLFGFFGIAIWAVQMGWIPFFAAGVINGIGHHKGYRNFESDDCSTNITNIGILIGGEELHNNHHAYPSSAKFSMKWWEFDIGWLYIKILGALGLATVLRTAPKPQPPRASYPAVASAPAGVNETSEDLSQALTPNTIASLIRGRPHILGEYTTRVLKPVLQREYKDAFKNKTEWFKNVRNALYKHKRHTTEQDMLALKEAVLNSLQLKTVCDFKERLEDLLHNYRDQGALVDMLHEWCRQAEKSGIRALEQFSYRVRTFSA